MISLRLRCGWVYFFNLFKTSTVLLSVSGPHHDDYKWKVFDIVLEIVDLMVSDHIQSFPLFNDLA